MSIRRGRPITIRPSGCTDSLDGTNAPPGSRFQLSNLVPAQRTGNYWSPRPARIYAASFYRQNTATFVTALKVIGNRAYGMVSSLDIPGHDYPFVINLPNGAQVIVAGVTAANTPLQPPG